MSNMEQLPLTREAFKQEQEEQKKSMVGQIIRIRLFPIWLRIIVVVIALSVALISGAIVGYSVMGNGKPAEVFQKETWTHIKDLVVKE